MENLDGGAAPTLTLPPLAGEGIDATSRFGGKR
jgi:hypothetical protein